MMPMMSVVPVVPRRHRRRRRNPVAVPALVVAAAVAGLGGHDGGVLEVGGEVEVLKLLWEAARRGDLRRFGFAFHE